MQVDATNGIYKQLGASCCTQTIVDTYTCIQVQAYATNGLQKQLGTSWSNYNNVDTYTCKYMQPMTYRNNQVEASATRIVWIHFHAFRYACATNGIQKQLDASWCNQNNVDTYTCKYKQPMVYRNNQVHAGATRIMWIPLHASKCNQWHIQTNRCQLV